MAAKTHGIRPSRRKDQDGDGEKMSRAQGSSLRYAGWPVPKLFEYFGLIVMFYSNEHDPIHVHGVYHGRESRAELILRDGKVVRIRFAGARGRKPLGIQQQRDFRKLVERFQDDIVRKWVEFFVLHKRVDPESIPRRLP